jgi:hypothetical protein
MRGDSGQSDSEFLKTQKMIQRKNKKFLKKIEEQAKPVFLGRKSQTLWERIKGIFK